MMSRAELEAKIWTITGRQLTGAAVDALLGLVDEYTRPAPAAPGRRVLRHQNSTDLWPVIKVLTEALLGTPDADLSYAFLPDDHPATTETRAA